GLLWVLDRALRADQQARGARWRPLRPARRRSRAQAVPRGVTGASPGLAGAAPRNHASAESARASGRRDMPTWRPAAPVQYARLSWYASEMRPMSGGETTSPKRWIAKIDRAIALARRVAETEKSVAALTGDTLAKIASSHTPSATRKPTQLGTSSAARA